MLYCSRDRRSLDSVKIGYYDFMLMRDLSNVSGCASVPTKIHENLKLEPETRPDSKALSVNNDGYDWAAEHEVTLAAENVPRIQGRFSLMIG